MACPYLNFQWDTRGEFAPFRIFSQLLSCQNLAETCCLVQETQFSLLPFPANCIYADEARGMQHDGGIQRFVEGRGFTGCGKTRLACHSEEPQATRNLALS
jgi:hypothetical protein